MNKYSVTYYYRAYLSMDVYAEDEEDAYKIFEERAKKMTEGPGPVLEFEDADIEFLGADAMGDKYNVTYYYKAYLTMDVYAEDERQAHKIFEKRVDMLIDESDLILDYDDSDIELLEENVKDVLMYVIVDKKETPVEKLW